MSKPETALSWLRTVVNHTFDLDAEEVPEQWIRRLPALDPPSAVVPIGAQSGIDGQTPHTAGGIRG